MTMNMANLGPGYSFHPEKPLLVQYYLKKKIRGEKLPLYPKILDMDVYEYSPWDLLASTRQDRDICDHSQDVDAYFFTKLTRTTKRGRRISRTVKNYGTWKEQCTKEVEDCDDGVVGMYKYFKFTPSSGTKLLVDDEFEWQMHEYSLEDNHDLVLCHIVAKNAKASKSSGKKRSWSSMGMSSSHEVRPMKRVLAEDDDSPECSPDSTKSDLVLRELGDDDSREGFPVLQGSESNIEELKKLCEICSGKNIGISIDPLQPDYDYLHGEKSRAETAL